MARKLSFFYHNLAVMLEAGVPILKALKTVAQGSRGSSGHIIHLIHNSVSQGNTLAHAMGLFPKMFTPLDITIVEVAEQSGNLSAVLAELGKWHEQQTQRKRKLTSGLTLPLLIFHAGCFIAPVPQILLGGGTIGDYFKQVVCYLCMFYLPFFIIMGIIQFTPRDGFLRSFLDVIVLKVPLLGKAVRYMGLSRFFLAFNLMYSSGVPILQILILSCRMTGNAVIRRWFLPCEQAVRDGNPVSSGFSPKIPVEYRDIWESGEISGNLDIISHKLADLSDDKAQFWMTQFIEWLPRVIYGLVCIFLVYAILKGISGISGRMNSLVF